MNTYYEVKVKYLQIDQAGYERKKTETLLFDAVSHTDAETRTVKQMAEITRGEFQINGIKPSNISEVLSFESGKWWYKAKISLIAIDEEKGREKKVNQYILVQADDTDQALKRLSDGLSYILVPYVVTAVVLSPIAEVFPYDFEAKSNEIMGE